MRVECPICGYEFEGKPIKTWKMSIWNVSRFRCPKCNKEFNLYVHGKNPEKKFTIPKKKQQ